METAWKEEASKARQSGETKSFAFYGFSNFTRYGFTIFLHSTPRLFGPTWQAWDSFVCACVFLSKKNNNKKCGWGWFVIVHCGFESWMRSAQLQKLGLSVKPPSLWAKQQSRKRKPWRNNGRARGLFIVVLQIHLNDRMENGPLGIQTIFSSWPRSFLRVQFSFLSSSPPLPFFFNFWKLFNRGEGKWLRNVWEWFGRMEYVA